MTLTKITGFFKGLEQEDAIIEEKDLKDALELLRSKLPSIKSYADIPKEDFQNCLRHIFTKNQLEYPLNDEQVEEIKQHLLINSVNGDIEEGIFVDLWKYFLRKNPRTVRALVLVDMQNDFIGGTLAIPEAADIIPVINGVVEKFSSKFDLIVYTQDWHPPNHISFYENRHVWPLHNSFKDKEDSLKMLDKVLFKFNNKLEPYEQVLWPTHCVQNSWGAELHKDLKQPQASDLIFKKGLDADRDYYSASWCSDNSRRTNFFNQLLQRNVTDVYVCGLAIDYCVNYTAQDLVKHGFNTYILEDACRAVTRSGGEASIEKLKSLNVSFVNSSELADKTKQWNTV